MAGDPYVQCPCGSGNKLKFCCADVAAEMEKVERLLANNQPRMALLALEKLVEVHGDSQWVLTSLASILINEDQAGRAKRLLAGLLKQHPQQPYANALFAMASFNEDGYPESKRAISRACKLSTTTFPDMVSALQAATARAQLEAGHLLAARQGLVLAMRLASEDRRPLLFQQLVELDGDPAIPYPLRSVRHPSALQGIDSNHEAVRKAGRLAAVGCWHEAADALATLAEERGDHPGLWYNAGLYRAWDGDHEPAVAALRRAAGCEADFETSVEYELLAQLLEQAAPDRSVPLRLRKFELESVSRLLSRLDEFPQLARIEDESEDDRDESGPAARFLVINRVLEPNEDFASWSCDDVPRVIGRVTIFDQDRQGDQPAQAYLVGLEGEELDRSLQLFRSGAGELATLVPPEVGASDTDDITGYIPRDQLGLRWSVYAPSEVPGRVIRAASDQWWQRLASEVWPNTPLLSLADRTPGQAAEDPTARVALAAAILVLDAHAEARRYLLPLDAIRDRLGVASPAVLPVTDQTNVNGLTLVQLGRVKLADLSQEQFQQVLRRATVVRQHRLLYDVLREALERPGEANEPMSSDRVYASLASLCTGTFRHEEALAWNEKGRQHAEMQPHAFEQVLEWKMRELTLRIEDPDDPHLTTLLEDLWHNYGAKLPQLREYLVTLVNVAGVTPPWDSSIITVGDMAAGSAGLPSATSTSTGREGKLWLPGDQ